MKVWTPFPQSQNSSTDEIEQMKILIWKYIIENIAKIL